MEFLGSGDVVPETFGKMGLQERLTPQGLEFLQRYKVQIIRDIAEWQSPSMAGTMMSGDDYNGPVQEYNALGAIYPSLTSAERLEGLAACVNQMRFVNTMKVGLFHTGDIRDPQ